MYSTGFPSCTKFLNIRYNIFSLKCHEYKRYNHPTIFYFKNKPIFYMDKLTKIPKFLYAFILLKPFLNFKNLFLFSFLFKLSFLPLSKSGLVSKSSTPPIKTMSWHTFSTRPKSSNNPLFTYSICALTQFPNRTRLLNQAPFPLFKLCLG